MTTTPDRRTSECRPAAPEQTHTSNHPGNDDNAGQGHTAAHNMLTIELPVQIDLRITPNRMRGGNRGYVSKLRNDLKDTAWLCTLAAINDHDGPQPAIPLVMHLEVYRGRNRKIMDDDNVIAWAKPVRDAIAATIGVDDKHITTGTIIQLRDPAGLGFVVVRLEHAS